MITGTVKWFNDAKGFGFIEPEAGGEDVFAHFSAIRMEGFRTLKQGGRVSFDVVDGPKGRLAQNIAALDAPASGERPQAADVPPPPEGDEQSGKATFAHEATDVTGEAAAPRHGSERAAAG